ncbi:MAG: hypothetical protein JXB46_00260 [Candidatus Eisenbacteria bacterium]|nr:hypothetical protein [Candidatus Eisenbacteria bacterium]
MNKTGLQEDQRKPTMAGDEGLTLVETMVAGFVLVVGVLGLMSAMCSSVALERTTQENNMALDVARQVIEQVKSEEFTSLLDRVEDTTPAEVPEGTVIGDSDGTDAEGDTVQSESYANYESNQWYDTYSSDYYSTNVQLYLDGSFDVVSYRDWQPRQALSPWPGSEHVGKVDIRQIADDVVEITVTMRWNGKHGLSEEILRCQTGDWR